MTDPLSEWSVRSVTVYSGELVATCLLIACIIIGFICVKCI
jgi:hypothetical protein